MKVMACGLSMAVCALSLTSIGLTLTPVRAKAQDNGGGPGSVSDLANKKIDLDLESSNLYYGLKLLFSQVKANFTIDESLKSLTVTAHLNQVPFRVALETLLKSTGTPLTYKVESGIYSVVPKVESPDQPVEEITKIEPDNTKSGGYRYGVIRPNNMSAADIVQAFGGHIVSVGYNPRDYGTGGLGGSMSNGTGGFGGGGLGGFGGGSSYGGYGGGSGGYGSTSGYGGYPTVYGASSGYSDSGFRPGITNTGGGGTSPGGSRPGAQ
jgi:hypothetical protein